MYWMSNTLKYPQWLPTTPIFLPSSRINLPQKLMNIVSIIFSKIRSLFFHSANMILIWGYNLILILLHHTRFWRQFNTHPRIIWFNVLWNNIWNTEITSISWYFDMLGFRIKASDTFVFESIPNKNVLHFWNLFLNKTSIWT